MANCAELDELGELNRLFLGDLKERAAQKRDCLGLPASVARMLDSAPKARIESAAAVPRALFRFELEAAGQTRSGETGAAAAGPAGFALRLTLLHSAWNLSRSSGYKARLLLGLSPQQVRRLRIMPISRLPALANAEGLVACAFAECLWLWRRLLTETHPDMKRYLVLTVLQPQAPAALRGRPAGEQTGA